MYFGSDVALMRKIADYLKKNFAGGTAAPAIELVYVFCKKMGIELDINMEAIAKINAHLLDIRKELSVFDMAKQLPKPFNPLTDRMPTEIDRFFNDAIDAARKDKEEDLLIFCRAIKMLVSNCLKTKKNSCFWSFFQ